jgi:hypothetical protein
MNQRRRNRGRWPLGAKANYLGALINQCAVPDLSVRLNDVGSGPKLQDHIYLFWEEGKQLHRIQSLEVPVILRRKKTDSFGRRFV